MIVTVPLPLPAKANTLEIRFHSTFWKAIYPIAAQLQRYIKGPLYWIGPSQKSKDTELAIAYITKRAIAEDTDQPVVLEAWVSHRLDADNSMKVLMDGIEKSGRIANDRQVQKLIVNKVRMKNEQFSFDLRLFTSADESPFAPVDAGACTGERLPDDTDGAE